MPTHFIYVGDLPITVYKNRFISAIPGYKVHDHGKIVLTIRDEKNDIVYEGPPIFSDELEKIVNNTNENSNPVLKFYKYKFN